MTMQTTLNIKDSLLNEAFKWADTHDKNELMTLALTEFIQNHRNTEIEHALLESREDMKQGRYTQETIDEHIKEMFD
jgi:hypothetical protein